MKKVTAVLLALLMLLSLAACGTTAEDTSASTEEVSEETSQFPETTEEARELIQTSLGAIPEAAVDIVCNNCFDTAMNPLCVPGRIVEQTLTITTGEEVVTIRSASYVDEADHFFEYNLTTSDGEESFSAMDATLFGEDVPCALSGVDEDDCMLTLYTPDMYEYATTLMYRYPFFGIGTDATVVSDETVGDERVVTLTQPSVAEGAEPDTLVFHMDSSNMLLSYEWSFVDWGNESVVRKAEFSYPQELDSAFLEAREELVDMDEDDSDELCRLTLVFSPGTAEEVTHEVTVPIGISLYIIASPDGSGYTVYTDEALTEPVDQYGFPDLNRESATLYVVFDEA